MRLLLLSAYDAASHRHWRQGLEQAFPDWQWTVLHLPPRHFRWRIRGNPLSWYQHPALHGDYDALVATSMVDLATLRGLLPGLARLPSALYFHENQFAYPRSAQQHQSLDPQMVNLYSALAADALWFNSAYNRDSFLDGVTALSRQLPERLPQAALDHLRQRAQVLPVALAGTPTAATTIAAHSHWHWVWNHRWEYDKGPDILLAAARALAEAALPVTVHVVGEQFRQQPPAMAALREVLTDAGQLGLWGYLPQRADYLALLQGCQGVLSTARHDFQGLAVLEGVAAGARPLVPDRLAYRDWFAPPYRYPSTPEDPETEGQAIAAQMARWQRQPPAPVSAEPWTWAQLRPRWQRAFADLLARA